MVRAAGEAGVAVKSRPWLMDFEAIGRQAALVRAAAAGFIGAAADDIAIVPSAAYGVATAAANLAVEAGTRILLIEGEYPSQSLEWARLAQSRGAVLDVVPRRAVRDGDWTAALLERIAAPGLPPVGVAALTPLVWTDGRLIDLERLAGPLRAQGAAIVVDATQAVGVLPVDVRRLAADYLVFPTYKWLLGPYTLAFLYVAPHRQQGVPLEQHGSNHAGAGGPFDGTLPPLLPGAARFDMGQRFNPVSLPMALAGMELLRGWGRAPLAERLGGTTAALARHAAAHGLVPVDAAMRPPHLLGLGMPAGSAPGFAERVVARLEAAGVYVAARGGQIRVGAHVYNDEEDVERFGSALRSALAGAGLS